MNDPLAERGAGRGTLVAAVGGLAWQVAVVALAFRQGPSIGRLETGLGISLPFVSDA